MALVVGCCAGPPIGPRESGRRWGDRVLIPSVKATPPGPPR